MKTEEVKALGRALLLSRANVNNCSTLLALIDSLLSRSTASSLDCLAEAVRCLHAFFLSVLKADDSLKSPGSTAAAVQDAETIYKTWLTDKYQEFIELLIKVLAATNVGLEHQKVALDAVMELIQVGKFHKTAYFNLCAALIEREEFNAQVLDVLVSDYFQETDLCYSTLMNVDKLILRRLQGGGSKELPIDDGASVSDDAFVRNVYEMVSKLSVVVQGLSGGKNQEKSSGTSGKDRGKKLKSRIRKIWLNFLQLTLPLYMYKKVLRDMSKVIIPTMPSPLRLSDFLTKSYDIGGVFSVMALDGLFILMTKHSLEYPEFYDKLYSLLDPSIFFTKYRSRFFELMDSCLSSPLLPAYLAAAFAKKLSRLSLSASPSGALIVTAMVHNLLRRHPSINCLVHESSKPKASEENDMEKEAEASGKPGKDPFLANETKPSQCNALESSLWEMESLRRHYCPAVSRFVESLETDLTVRAKTTEVNITDFSSGSYSTIFREETKRRIKQVPLAFYSSTPSSLFPENVESGDDFSGWSFVKRRKLDMISP